MFAVPRISHDLAFEWSLSDATCSLGSNDFVASFCNIATGAHQLRVCGHLAYAAFEGRLEASLVGGDGAWLNFEIELCRQCFVIRCEGRAVASVYFDTGEIWASEKIFTTEREHLGTWARSGGNVVWMNGRAIARLTSGDGLRRIIPEQRMARIRQWDPARTDVEELVLLAIVTVESLFYRSPSSAAAAASMPLRPISLIEENAPWML